MKVKTTLNNDEINEIALKKIDTIIYTCQDIRSIINRLEVKYDLDPDFKTLTNYVNIEYEYVAYWAKEFENKITIIKKSIEFITKNVNLTELFKTNNYSIDDLEFMWEFYILYEELKNVKKCQHLKLNVRNVNCGYVTYLDEQLLLFCEVVTNIINGTYKQYKRDLFWQKKQERIENARQKLMECKKITKAEKHLLKRNNIDISYWCKE